MDNSSLKRNTYLPFLVKYSFAFAVVAVLVFIRLIITGNTFIWYADGLEQHYNALIFYGEHLRTVLRMVFIDHNLDIPSWSFSIGEGADILQVLHYYVIGAPLCALSVFFNEDNMYVLYGIIVIARLYLSGLSFAYLCKTNGVRNTNGILIGAIAYVFGFWSMYNSVRHFMFLIPVVLLPLVIAGTEKVIRKQNPFVLVTSVFLCALSNFYFFYMIVILTVIYTAVRGVVMYGKNVREWLVTVRNMLIYSVTGVLAAGVVLLPVLYVFLNDARNSGVNNIRLIYPLIHYLSIPHVLFGPVESYWLCLAFTVTQVAALIMLFIHKGEHKTLKILSVICLIFILVPFFGQMFNGMAYMANKWCFAISLLVSYILTSEYDQLVERSDVYKKIPYLVVLIFLWTIPSGDVMSNDIIVGLLMLTVFGLVAGKFKSKKKEYIIFGFTVLSVLVISFFFFSPRYGNYLPELRTVEQIRDYYNDDGVIASELLGEEETFYRYSGCELQINSALNKGVSSPAYFWTISNPYTVAFNESLSLDNYFIHKCLNYDDRTIMTELSSVMYYFVPEQGGIVPYGYILYDDESSDCYDIYRNDDPLGLCFSSDSLIRRSYWDTLTPSQREEALLNGVVVSDEVVSELNDIHPELRTLQTDYTSELIESDGLTVLRFEGVPCAETHIQINGIVMNDSVDAELVVQSSSGVIKTLELHEDGYEYYNGRHDFVINLGYNEEPLTWVAISVVGSDDYSYDSITVNCIPMDGTSELIDELMENAPETVDIGTDEISCSVTSAEPQMLVFTIPYSEGWSAEIDGESAEVVNADIKYLGIQIPAGSHEIVLTYRTPWFNAGLVSTAVGIVLTAVEVILYKRRSRLSL